MKPYILAHDLGTSGDKATLFSVDGRLISSRTSAYATSYDQGNRAEQNPEDWWRAVRETTQAILETVDKREIAVVCLSGQMMGCVCVDRVGRPLRNSIIYSDQRATRQARTLLEAIDAREIYRTTGHRASASYSIEKLMWIRDHEHAVYSQTHKMLNAKDFINLRLTGSYFTDFNDASGTNCFDINTKGWSDRILDAAGIDAKLLPEAHESTFVAGAVTASAAAETGLAADTPVVVGAGDGGCASIGVGSVAEGVSYNYLGSSSWISTATREPVVDETMRTFTWVLPVPGLYQPCGTMQTAGSSVSWLAANLFGRPAGEEDEAGALESINREAAASPPGSNGILFLPYLLGERSPRWNPDAKGAWIGLKLSNGRGDLARAVLEGVAFNLEIVLSILQRHIPIDELIIIGGGGRSALWRQILADIFGVRIRVPEYLEEATSMGAAIIGGVGSGCFDFEEGARRFVRLRESVEPNAQRASLYDSIKPLFEEAYVSLESVMAGL